MGGVSHTWRRDGLLSPGDSVSAALLVLLLLPRGQDMARQHANDSALTAV